MERRKALATAASVSAVALAATLALGANVGLFGLTSSDNGPGSFELVDSKTSEPIVRTEIVDVPITTQGSGGSTGDPTTSSTTPSASTDGTSPSTTVATSPHDDDHDHDHEAEDDSQESEPTHDEDD